MFQNRVVFFFTLSPGSGFGAAISHAVARNSILFCNSISRYRTVMVASRSLGAAAACVILLSFAAGQEWLHQACGSHLSADFLNFVRALYSTKYFGQAFCVNASVSQVSVCKNFLRPTVFFARDFSLIVRAFWRAEQLR